MSNILIFKAGTGIGKSVIFVPQVFTQFGSLLCTQPKITNVVSIANSVDQLYSNIKLGSNLGYKTSVESVQTTIEPELFLCTTEVLNSLLRKSIHITKTAIKYKYVIIDEVHEQSIEMSNVINNLKVYMWIIDPELFVVFTSATLDEQSLSWMFNLNLSKQLLLFEAIQTDNSFEYPKSNPTNLLTYFVEVIKQHNRKNILIFLPYFSVIKCVANHL